MNDTPAPTASQPTPLTRPRTFPPGRLGTFVAMGAASGALPLPFVPPTLLRRVRGALAHDVVTRHGLCLTPEARRVLAEPDSADPQRAQIIRLSSFVAARLLRRLGPLGFIGPTMSALDTFALGLLLDRYLDQVRRGHSVRIQAQEARSIRTLIDRSLVRTLSRTLPVAQEGSIESPPAEDLRDDTTRITDLVLLLGASLPAYLVRRLESAFDAIVAENPEEVEP